MNHSDFQIGGEFWCGGRQWRCSDIGTRTIVAIRIDPIQIEGTNHTNTLSKMWARTLNRAEAEAEGFFTGPPYAVKETVFDESDMEACSGERDGEKAQI